MATPHTVGVAALYLEAHPTASPSAVRDALYNATTKGVVTSSSTTNNHLLYSLFSGGGGTAPTAAVQRHPDERAGALERPVHRLVDGIADLLVVELR